MFPTAYPAVFSIVPKTHLPHVINDTVSSPLPGIKYKIVKTKKAHLEEFCKTMHHFAWEKSMLNKFKQHFIFWHLNNRQPFWQLKHTHTRALTDTCHYQGPISVMKLFQITHPGLLRCMALCLLSHWQCLKLLLSLVALKISLPWLSNMISLVCIGMRSINYLFLHAHLLVVCLLVFCLDTETLICWHCQWLFSIISPLLHLECSASLLH